MDVRAVAIRELVMVAAVAICSGVVEIIGVAGTETLLALRATCSGIKAWLLERLNPPGP